MLITGSHMLGTNCLLRLVPINQANVFKLIDDYVREQAKNIKTNMFTFVCPWAMI